MKLRISCDDGCASDVRLADLCLKYGVDCTFYWPVEWHSLAYDKGYEPLNYLEATALAHEFEVGSHTITHRHLTKLEPEDALYEIMFSQHMLQGLLGVKVRKFAPPRGYTNSKLTDAVLSVYDSQRLTKGDHLIHIHPNSGANNNVHWIEAVNEKTTELWCHSWELDKYNLWGELEDFLSQQQ